MGNVLLNIDEASNEAIAALCADTNILRDVIFTIEGGCSIIKISDTVVVKVGATEREARNQAIARDIIDMEIAYVPKVYQFFQYEGRRYLVMEYINGKPFNKVDPLDATSRLLKAIRHFSQIRSNQAGSLSGGRPSGLIWSDCFDANPSNTDDVEDYFNVRLRKYSEHVTLTQRNLVLCHLDLADRNILFFNDGRLCLLDWDSAGFYPQALEYCSLHLNWQGAGGDTDLVDRILNMLQTTDLYRQSEVRLIYEGWLSGQRHWFGPKLKPSLSSKSKKWKSRQSSQKAFSPEIHT